LDVFNITGQLVETITNQVYSAGTHTLTYKAENLASGVYFYRLKATNFVSTKRFTLIK
jgi:hypothetical protein